MYKHILIATDGSEPAQKAVDQGLRLAKELGAEASGVMITEPWGWGAEAPEVAIAYPFEEAARFNRELEVFAPRMSQGCRPPA
jgi:nucleotide-binding universal stress UspA family protein